MVEHTRPSPPTPLRGGRSRTGRWAGLIVAMVALVGVTWLVVREYGPRAQQEIAARGVEATVVEQQSCSAPDSGDQVRFTLRGESHRSELSGCGYQKDTVLTVDVPQAVLAGEPGSRVVLSSTRPQPRPPGQRMAAAGMIGASGVAAGLLMMLVHGRAGPAPHRHRRAKRAPTGHRS